MIISNLDINYLFTIEDPFNIVNFIIEKLIKSNKHSILYNNKNSWLLNKKVQVNTIRLENKYTIWCCGILQDLALLYLRDEIIPRFNQNDYLLIVNWGLGVIKHDFIIRNTKYRNNIIYLSNEKNEIDYYNNVLNIRTYLIHHNCFIDRDAFNVLNIPKKYDAIMNVGLNHDGKRPLLSKKINNTVHTSNCEPNEKNMQMIKEQKRDLFVNLTNDKLKYLMNQSRCGLIFSAAEGGSLTTTEYLYCGIPVLSTHNKGGRNTYLDDSNSLFCEDNENDVYTSFHTLINKKLDPICIRNKALKLSDSMLMTLKNDILKPIFEKYNDPNLDSFFINAIKPKKDISGSKGVTLFSPEKSLGTKQLFKYLNI